MNPTNITMIEHKVFEAEVKEFDEKDLTVVHFISTERKDRGNDILYADGMRIEGKPVVLQQHGWGVMGYEPIAKPVWIKKGEFKNRKGIQAKTQFYPDELGRRLWEKTTQGYMPNWSIGWRPVPGKEEIKTERDGSQTRHVYEWDLFEYSIVGVPMQPDAQTLYGKGWTADMIGGALQDDRNIMFKIVPCICDPKCEGEICRYEARGELVAWKNEDGEWEAKPYPSEHSCRLESPDKYIRIRRENDKFGNGIHAIWGVQAGSKPVELQAIRFSLSKFTADEAKAWLKAHDYKCKSFEAATGGKADEGCGCEDEEARKISIDIDPTAWADLMVDFSQQQTRVTNMLNEIAELKTEIETLKSTLKGLVAPEPTPAIQSENPPALVIERDDLEIKLDKEMMRGMISEVVGEKIRSEIDRMKGKVK